MKVEKARDEVVQRSSFRMTDCRRNEIRTDVPIRLQIDLDQKASMAVDFVLMLGT
jgi:hypothetical protein